MRGTAKHKVVSSGRLTGGVKGQPGRSRVSQKPAAWKEPSYSLYSTDSEDQVTTIHNGLDRCAALLNGILQAERAEAKPGLTGRVEGGAAKPKVSVGRKITKKTVTKKAPAQKSSLSSQAHPGLTASQQSRPPFPAAVQRRAASPAVRRPVPSPVATADPGRPAKQHPRAKPELIPPDLGTGAHFNTRLTTSTPTLSLERPVSPRTEHPANTNPPGQQQLSAQPDAPEQHRPESEASGASNPQGTPTLERCGHREATSAGADEEEERVPVKDTNHLNISDKHPHTHEGDTDSNTHSSLQLEPGQQDTLRLHRDAPGAGRDGRAAETEGKVKEVQHLLGELKARITGQDAAQLLSDLEQTVSLLPLAADRSNIQAEVALMLQPLYSQNTQLRRRLRILNQQLQQREKTERESTDRQCDSEVWTMQAELSAAQSQLQQLQDDVTELRQALQDTHRQLRETEAENTLIKTDLETASRRLLESERERSEVALLAQQRLEEIQNLNRILQTRVSSAVTESSATCPPLTKQLLDQYQHRQDPSDPAPDTISQYLISLGQGGCVLAGRSDVEPTVSVGETAGGSVCTLEQEGSVCAPAEREGKQSEQQKLTFIPQRETMMSLHPDMSSQQTDGLPVASEAPSQSLDAVFKLLQKSKSLVGPHLETHGQSSERQLEKGQRLLFDSSLSQWEVGSVLSDCSAASGSTFNTRDEVAFRDGLAALDASIASLQRTIKMDLGR
ncbi:coiled-coil domain-containing protein 14 [Myripristis murdjan]|uniref:Coiled-coil domain containing 14 n=1 Tax=Myripristis murdjan TaxID=586833 RepID=A0A667Z154_9TELE|nr:coiled-coil domain-containing protein 14 [Myripristis murdjan]